MPARFVRLVTVCVLIMAALAGPFSLGQRPVPVSAASAAQVGPSPVLTVNGQTEGPVAIAPDVPFDYTVSGLPVVGQNGVIAVANGVIALAVSVSGSPFQPAAALVPFATGSATASGQITFAPDNPYFALEAQVPPGLSVRLALVAVVDYLTDSSGTVLKATSEPFLLRSFGLDPSMIDLELTVNQQTSGPLSLAPGETLSYQISGAPEGPFGQALYLYLTPDPDAFLAAVPALFSSGTLDPYLGVLVGTGSSGTGQISPQADILGGTLYLVGVLLLPTVSESGPTVTVVGSNVIEVNLVGFANLSVGLTVEGQGTSPVTIAPDVPFQYAITGGPSDPSIPSLTYLFLTPDPDALAEAVAALTPATLTSLDPAVGAPLAVSSSGTAAIPIQALEAYDEPLYLVGAILVTRATGDGIFALTAFTSNAIEVSFDLADLSLSGLPSPLAVTEETPANANFSVEGAINPGNVTIAVTTEPDYGTVSLSGTGANRTLTYTPDTNATGDEDGNDTFSLTVAEGSRSSVVTVRVHFTPVDDAPAFASGSVPTIDPVEGNVLGGATVTFALPTATDVDLPDGDEATEVACTAPLGENGAAIPSIAGTTVFPVGTTTVTCTATNFRADGDTSTVTDPVTVTFDITVTDETAPELTVPANINAAATGPSGATVTFSATATDIVDGIITPECVRPSGSTFPFGVTTVTCTVTDAHGNSVSKQFTVTVADASTPTIVFIGGPAQNATYTQATLPAAPTCTATGFVFPVVDCKVTGYSTEPGRHTLTARARDSRGRAVVATRSYTVTGSAATSTPTVRPTSTPTVRPTVAPTVRPTVAPTTQPTVAPTTPPTAVPTTRPARTPVSQPTATPAPTRPPRTP